MTTIAELYIHIYFYCIRYLEFHFITFINLFDRKKADARNHDKNICVLGLNFWDKLFKACTYFHCNIGILLQIVCFITYQPDN